MRHSVETRDSIYVKSHGFKSFAKYIGAHPTKVAKNMSSKYSQKLFDKARKPTTDSIKTASKRAV